MALIANHEAATDPHPQYIKRSGDTMQGALKGHHPGARRLQQELRHHGVFGDQGLVFPRAGIVGTEAATKLTVANVGRVVNVATENAVITLPLTSTVPVGASLMIRCVANNAKIVVQGSDLLATLGSALGGMTRPWRCRWAPLSRWCAMKRACGTSAKRAPKSPQASWPTSSACLCPQAGLSRWASS
jgi:hypothetical protein